MPGDCKRHFSTSEIFVKKEMENIYNFRLCLSLPKTILQITSSCTLQPMMNNLKSQFCWIATINNIFPAKVDAAMPTEPLVSQDVNYCCHLVDFLLTTTDDPHSSIKDTRYLNTCTAHLLLFCTITNNCTINWHIITLLLHVSTLLCHPRGAILL